MRGQKEKEFVHAKMGDHFFFNAPPSSEFNDYEKARSHVGLGGTAKSEHCANSKYYRLAYKDLQEMRRKRKQRLMEKEGS